MKFWIFLPCPCSQVLLTHRGGFPWKKRWQKSWGHLSMGRADWPLDCSFSSAWDCLPHSRAQFHTTWKCRFIWFCSLPQTCWSGMGVQELFPEPQTPRPRIWAMPTVCPTLSNQTLWKVRGIPDLHCRVGRAFSGPSPRAESLMHPYSCRANISALLGHFQWWDTNSGRNAVDSDPSDYIQGIPYIERRAPSYSSSQCWLCVVPLRACPKARESPLHYGRTQRLIPVFTCPSSSVNWWRL